MILLVCGSRDWTDAAPIAARLSALPGEHEEIWILHGAARGADTIAAFEAKALGFTVRAYPADWERYGKRAGILRNLQMLEEEPDLVLAFQIDGSRGTQHTIDEARRRGIPVEVIAPVADGRLWPQTFEDVCGPANAVLGDDKEAA
jgi:hypothetical protein